MEKVICPHCKTVSGLYKSLDGDGKWHTKCLHCNYELKVEDYHGEEKISTIHELENEQR